MHQIGVIAEYNPFHRGHHWQYTYLREKLGENTAITVALSSNFCQRGSPALLDVRKRARAAIYAGADLVILLPQAFTAVDGETYARAGVELLARTGVVKMLAASSEINDKTLLEEAAELISPESLELKDLIKKKIGLGLSPHQARSDALKSLGVDPDLVACFESPNSRLVTEYLAALNQLELENKPGFFLCPRQELWQDKNGISYPAQSASDLRDFVSSYFSDQSFNLKNEQLLDYEFVDQLRYHLPASSLAILLDAVQVDDLCSELVFLDYAKQLIIRADNPNDLNHFRYWESGLANRLFKLAHETEPITQAKTRNFSEGRIRRALVSLCLNIKTEDLASKLKSPAFIYPLAYSKRGRYLLRKMRERASLPVIGRFSEALNHSDDKIRSQAEIENRSWALHAYLRSNKLAQKDLLEPPQDLKYREI